MSRTSLSAAVFAALVAAGGVANADLSRGVISTFRGQLVISKDELPEGKNDKETTAKIKAASLKELIALAKAEPGKLNFGSSGNGSTNHLAGELFKSLAGIDIVHIPYRGASPAMNDLIAGHIPMMFDNMPAVRPQVEGGAVLALAVAGAKRSPVFPNVPTMMEAGVKGFEATAWFGLVAPAKTPADVLKTLDDASAKVLADPDTAQKFAALGADPGTAIGEAFGAFLKEEAAKWGKVVEASGAKVD